MTVQLFKGASLPLDLIEDFSLWPCRFALPALLPLITPDLNMTDQEGALLTVGYTVGSRTLVLKPLLVMPARVISAEGAVGAVSLPAFGGKARIACPMQVLYAVALVPAGFLADRTDRPRMLAGGLGVWSLLTMAASKASTARIPAQKCLVNLRAPAEDGAVSQLLSQGLGHISLGGCLRAHRE